MSSCRCAVPSGAGFVHCRACCTSFANVTLFDLHRTGTVNHRDCTTFPTVEDAYFLGTRDPETGDYPATVTFYPENGVWGTEAYQTLLDRARSARVTRVQRKQTQST